MAFMKKGNLVLIVLYSLGLFAFLQINRNSSFFTLIAAFVIVRAAKDIGFAEKWSKAGWSAAADKVILGGVVVFCIIQSLNICNEKIYLNGKEVRSMFLKANPYVVSSIKALTDNGIHGRVFESSLLGGSLLWFGYPQLRPFNDGRDADKERFNNWIAIFLNPKEIWPLAERHYGFKIVILSTDNPLEQKFYKYFFTRTDWQLIHVSGHFVVYVKKGEFRLPEELEQYERHLNAMTLTPQLLTELDSASQRPPSSTWDSFFHPSPVEVDLFSRGETLMGLGYEAAAARDFVGAMKVSDQPYMRQTVRNFLRTKY
jgi:hypothetical protein